MNEEKNRLLEDLYQKYYDAVFRWCFQEVHFQACYIPLIEDCIHDAFRKAILKSSVSTEVKVKLMDYLAVKKSAESIKILASMIFDYFKNTKDVLENSAEETSVEALKTAIMAELEPSIMQFEDEQINLLITLIIKEYTDRCYVDYPIWHEFAIRIARGDII